VGGARFATGVPSYGRHASGHAAAIGKPAVIGWAVPMVVMAFVLSITPGPNNVLLTIAGAQHGWWRTVPSLAGILGGFMTIIGLCLLGVGQVVKTVPGVHAVLMVAATTYMVWLAARLWRSTGHGSPAPAMSVLGCWRFATLQFVNPKTWLASLALVSGYLEGRQLDSLERLLAIALFLGVISVSMTVWVSFGSLIRARMTPDRWRIVNRVLAVLAASTVVTFWV